MQLIWLNEVRTDEGKWMGINSNNTEVYKGMMGEQLQADYAHICRWFTILALNLIQFNFRKLKQKLQLNRPVPRIQWEYQIHNVLLLFVPLSPRQSFMWGCKGIIQKLQSMQNEDRLILKPRITQQYTAWILPWVAQAPVKFERSRFLPWL